MYNRQYAWFDKLNDHERKLFFNFLVGYLSLKPEQLKKIYDEFSATSLIGTFV